MWHPRQDAALEIARLLQALSMPESREAHAAAQQTLQTFSQNPEFSLYLSHLLAHTFAEVSLGMRQLSGLVLKNQIRQGSMKALDDPYKRLIRHNAMAAVRDPEAAVRKVSGIVITTIVSFEGLKEWPDLIDCLGLMLESGDMGQMDGAFSALLKLCEDSAAELDSEDLGRPLNTLIPRLLPFLGHGSTELRLYALQCLNSLISILPAALLLSMNDFLLALSSLAEDSSASIRMNVCRAISLIVNEKPDALLPHMHSICQFMLRAQADEDEAVAIEAGEFWPTCCYSDAKSTVQALLPELIPILLSRMRYSEEELAELRVDGDDNEGIPDRPEDIRPLFHKGGGGGNGGDEDDGDDDDDEGLYAWTVRKCCAAALDHLATCMGGPGILPCLLPVLQEMLGNHGDVWARESAILALGAVSEGCMQGMDEHLPQLLPFLLGQMEDAVPQARSISCWTLSRYSGWICQAPEGNPWLGPALDALVRRVLDCNKKVQEAACSALATLEEMLGERLVGEALDRVLAALTMALGKYQMRSLIILYDTIGTLADVVGGALSEERRVAVLMPPLMAKWESVPDGDRHLFPLLECLTSISQALGMAFQPFAPRLFYRSVALVQSTLLGHAAVAELGGDAPDMEFAVCALDLISGMMEGMGGSMESLVTESNLLLLLDKCLQEKDSALQQSACALVGDLAKSAFARLAPALQQYMPHLIARLRAPPQQPASVCNNASWAISEICTRWGGEAMLRWVPLIMERIIPLLSQGGAAQDLHQNLAITLGHLVVTCPALLAQECASFAEGWCRAMNTIEEDADRRQMLEALALLIRTNPSSMLPFLPSVCVALANSVVSDRGTLESYAHIFASYRSIMGEAAWAELWQRLPGRVVRYLRDDCKIVQLP